jgi:hypothetical protein
MARVQQQSDRDFSADPPSNQGDAENFAHLLGQSEIPELFDDAIRLRFGKMISAAVLQQGKRKRKRH